MNSKLIFLLALICGPSIMQSAPLNQETVGPVDLQKVGHVLRQLEAARRAQKLEAGVDHFDLSQVVQVLQLLNEDDLQFIEKELPMLDTLFKALKRNAKPEGAVANWPDLCDDQCTSESVRQYLENRPADISSYFVHDLDHTKVERLANVMLKRDANISDQLVHEAVEEFQDLMDVFSSVGRGGHSLRFDLYFIEKGVDYFDRFAGRAVSAMWPNYKQRVEYENFADIFREQFYEMLHQNGYGIRHGQVVKIPASGHKFVV